MPLTPWIAPSILSANFARLGEEVDAVLAAGADIVHFDVMDNHYVPNLTIGPLVCEALRKHGVKAPIDVHLMVKPVDRIIPDFAKAGATYISFHPEASEHVDRTIGLIREHGCKAGLVFNPATPLDYLDYTLDKLDLVLLMSVNPGFGGQKFIPAALAKLREVRQRIDAQRPRDPAGSRRRRQGRQHRRDRRGRAPTRSWRARRSSARRTIAPTIARDAAGTSQRAAAPDAPKPRWRLLVVVLVVFILISDAEAGIALRRALLPAGPLRRHDDRPGLHASAAR